MAIEKELIIKYTIDRMQAKREMDAHERESRDSFRKVSQAAKETGDSTRGAADALMGLLPSITAIGGAASVFSAVNQGIKETSERVKALTDDFIKQRDAMRDLAGVMGQKGDIAFTQQQYEFAGRAGMNIEQAGAFRAAFQGEAQQYKGKFKDEGEFAKFEEQAARYSATMGLSPDVAAKIAGGAIRSMAPGSTSSQGMLALGQAFGTMQQGSGSNDVLAAQLAQTTGAMVGPGNAFKDIQQAAVGVRLMAEANPEAAFTELQAMRTDTLKLDDKEKSFFGIDKKTDFFDVIRKVGAKSKEAIAGGDTLDNFLLKYFPNERSRRGFAVAISKGLDQGVLDAGLADVNKVGEGDTEGRVDEAFNDPKQAMMLRQNEAQRRAADARSAQPGTLVAPYLEQARTQMADSNSNGLIGGGRKLADTLLYGPAALGLNRMGTKQMEEYARASGVIQGEAREAGVDVGPGLGGAEIFSSTPDQLNKRLAEMVELLRQGNDQRARQAPVVPPPMNGKPNVPAQMPR